MNASLVKNLTNYAEEAFTKRNFGEAMDYSIQAIQISKKLGLKPALSQLHLLQGKIHNSQGKYKQDENLINQAEAAFHRAQQYSSPSNAEILLQYGHVYFNKKNYDLALKRYGQALQIAEGQQNLNIIIKSMTAISRLYAAEKLFKESLELVEQAFMILEEETKPCIKVECHEQYISALIKMANFAKVTRTVPKSLELARANNDVENEAKILNSYAITFAVKGEYKRAFEYFLASKKISEEIGFYENTAKCLINIGNIYSALSNSEEAYKHLYRLISNKLLIQSIDDYTKGALYYNLASVAHAYEKFEEAESYFLKARRLGQENDNPRLIARTQYELMRVYLSEGKVKEAVRLAKSTNQLYETIGELRGTETHLANIAEISYVEKNYKKSIKYALLALETSNKAQNYKTRKRSYKLLADSYKSLGDFENAFNYLELYTEATEKFFKEMRRRAMVDLEMKYETTEKEKQIELLKSKMQLQELELFHAKELAQQNQKVLNAQEETKQFTYAVSHDLKEPLRMIGSFTKLLFRKYQVNADQTDIEYFSYITGGVTRMSALLNALLEYGELGKHSDDKEWVNVQQIINDVLITLVVKVKESNATIDFGEMPDVLTNRMLFFQLIQNLIANALKFKKPDVDTHIKIDYHQEKEFHTFSIADNGIGIAKKNFKSIFGIFSRLHRKDEYEGTGIGLAMCKKIVNHIKGKISVESEEGTGTTFFISVPKASIKQLLDRENANLG